MHRFVIFAFELYCDLKVIGLEMTSFDRSYITSYLRSIVNMTLILYTFLRYLILKNMSTLKCQSGVM